MIKFHEKHLQAQKRSVEREAPQLPLNDASETLLIKRLVSNFSSPSVHVAKKEAKQMLLHAVQSLRPKDRQIIELMYLEQMKAQEVADLLGISQPTVWTRHLRAIKRLTKALQLSPE